MIRFLRWCLGLEVVDLWRERYGQAVAATDRLAITLRTAETALLDAHLRHRKELVSDREANQRLNLENSALLRDVSRLTAELQMEAALRSLYEQVVIEAGEQIIKNNGTTPKTILGVLRQVFVAAVATATEWREAGQPEPGEVLNLRAGLATKLLPDPDQSGDRGGLVTERKRDGRVGDSGRAPDPAKPHLYQYPVSGTDIHCAVRGCGKTLTDDLHNPGHPKWVAEREANLLAHIMPGYHRWHTFEATTHGALCGRCGKSVGDMIHAGEETRP